MVRTSDRDLFLKRLARLAGAEGGFVTNDSLREELRWEKAKYRAIHGSLRQEELIVVKRGRGEIVFGEDLTLAPPRMKEPVLSGPH